MCVFVFSLCLYTYLDSAPMKVIDQTSQGHKSDPGHSCPLQLFILQLILVSTGEWCDFRIIDNSLAVNGAVLKYSGHFGFSLCNFIWEYKLVALRSGHNLKPI